MLRNVVMLAVKFLFMRGVVGRWVGGMDTRKSETFVRWFLVVHEILRVGWDPERVHFATK